MLFPTVSFAIFFTVVLAIFWLLRPYRVAWRLFLLAASYFFYAAWEARFLLLLALMTVANWLLARAILAARARQGSRSRRAEDSGEQFAPRLGAGPDAATPLRTPDQALAFGALDAAVAPSSDVGLALAEAAGGSAFLHVNGHVTVAPAPSTVLPAPVHRRPLADLSARLLSPRVLLALGIVLDLTVLGWFKYEGFFASSLVNLCARLGFELPLPLLQLTLPIGVSFFTFQAISYLVDVARDDYAPMSLLDFATYIAFFPHVVAGPIVRASEFGPQMDGPMRRDAIPAAAAFTLIAAGLFKKVVVANYLATELVDPVFGVPGQHNALEILLAIYGYAIQIFADFSGYTDIAIGCALLLGFRLPQNFQSPYASVSLQDFWRRWHMTLSRWLRDYLYIPLGGSRGSSILTRRNLLITFVLGGLWHGAAWTFVIWGAIHGLWLSIEGLLGLRSRRGRAWTITRWLVTFHVVCFAWVFFRAESLDSAADILGRLVTAWGGAAPLVTPAVLLLVAGSLLAQFAPTSWLPRFQERFARLGLVPQAASLGLVLVLIDGLGPRGVAPFIYFQF